MPPGNLSLAFSAAPSPLLALNVTLGVHGCSLLTLGFPLQTHKNHLGVLSVLLFFGFAFFFSSSEDGKETGKA